MRPEVTFIPIKNTKDGIIGSVWGWGDVGGVSEQFPMKLEVMVTTGCGTIFEDRK